MKVLILLSMAFSSRQNRSSRSSWTIRLHHAWKLHPTLPWQCHTTAFLSCTPRWSSSSHQVQRTALAGHPIFHLLQLCLVEMSCEVCACVQASYISTIWVSMHLHSLCITIKHTHFPYQLCSPMGIHLNLWILLISSMSLRWVFLEKLLRFFWYESFVLSPSEMSLVWVVLWAAIAAAWLYGGIQQWRLDWEWVKCWAHLLCFLITVYPVIISKSLMPSVFCSWNTEADNAASPVAM